MRIINYHNMFFKVNVKVQLCVSACLTRSPSDYSSTPKRQHPIPSPTRGLNTQEPPSARPAGIRGIGIGLKCLLVYMVTVL